ncbi:RES family NAD+ phosphorylase [Leptospira sp. 85282-16]|uniref:RES family NAD+ phosphorylase n=1 Tax=Leptospira sp. 85282-16 TaxID=2971256 RepID=UPI0021C0F656|nr:RES family NAD+ phosphorylase [Leptospira sp. 85282-16]MCT8335822.1 RES family NAD+ phosphorylase [Leptospira sp. 85282-16]
MTWYLCKNCIKHQELITFYEISKKELKKCVVCGKTEQSIKFSKNLHLQNLTRSIIRFEYSEYEVENYDRLIYNLQKENPILPHTGFAKKANNYFTKKYFGKWTDKPISELFGIDRRDNEIPIFMNEEFPERENVKAIYSQPLKEFSIDWEKLLSYYNEKKYQKITKILRSNLSDELHILKKIIKKEAVFSRARIGYEEKNISQKYKIKIPYSGKEIDRPPAKYASNGKFNEENIPIFYGATTDLTAVAEVRPHPGHYISVAKFLLKEDIEVIDLTKIPLYLFCNSKKTLETFTFLKHLQNFINTPIIPEKQDLYLLTQTIADISRNMGFSGIYYQSSVSKGQNIALFGDQICIIDNSSKLYKVKEVSFNFDEVKYTNTRKNILKET